MSQQRPQARDATTAREAAPDTAPAPAALPPYMVRRIVLASMIVLFLAALDQTVVSTALPSIVGDLGRFELTSWIVTAYLLTSTCAAAVFGRLSDLYGRRLIMRVVLTTFLVGSALCALSTTMPMLIGARALQGIGGGGLITLSQAILADVVSPRERGRYSAYFSILWAASSLLGPAIGGVLTEFASWNWIFWINLPIGAVAMGMGDRLLRHLPIAGRRSSIDYLGIAWLVLGTTSLLLALSWGGVTHPWLSLPVGLAFAGFVLFGLLFFQRQYNQEAAFLPPRFFRNPVVGPMLLTIFLYHGSFIALSVLSPAFLQIGLGRTAAEAGLLMVPMLIASSVTASWCGKRVSRTGDYKTPPMIGMPFAVAALLALGLGARFLSPVATALLLTVVGLGCGPGFPIANVATQNAVERRDFGAVSGAVAFARALGSAIMTAAASALILTLVTLWIPTASHLAGVQDLVRQVLSAPDHDSLLDAFAGMFLLLGAMMAVSMLAFWRVESRTLAKHLPPVDAEPV